MGVRSALQVKLILTPGVCNLFMPSVVLRQMLALPIHSTYYSNQIGNQIIVHLKLYQLLSITCTADVLYLHHVKNVPK